MTLSAEPGSDTRSSASRRFQVTQWSMILKARDEGAPGAAEAMEEFARTYWRPLYGFIRWQRYRRQDAQDLTQDFYCCFREKRLWERIREPRGKLRSFPLTCLKNFLSDQRDRATALKRGGGRSFVPLDAFEAEERDAHEPADAGLTPDQIHERRWARALMARAQARLREEYVTEGQAALHDALVNPPPGGRAESGLAELAARLGMSEAALKSRKHRLSRRHQEILRAEIARTVGSPREIEDEIRHLIRWMGA